MFRNEKILNLVALITSLVVIISAFHFAPAQLVDAYSYLSYGIDVSKFQGAIDWNAVASDNIDFAIIRAGTTSIDLF